MLVQHTVCTWNSTQTSGCGRIRLRKLVSVSQWIC